MKGDSLRVFSWNVNGLRAVLRRGDLRSFVERCRPDVLLLQETKIAEAQVAECGVREEFSEYEQFYSFAAKAGYAGTAVWVRRGVGDEGAVRVADVDGDGLMDEYGDLLKEGRITAVEAAGLCVVSVYVPNAKDDLSRLAVRQKWDRYFGEVLRELGARRPVVAGGDFNVAHEPIDLARPKENVGKHGFTDEERAGFSEVLAAGGMVDSFRLLHPEKVAYSWWSHWGRARERNVGWRIDYILSSDSLRERVVGAGIWPEILGSDHCPVELRLRWERGL